MVTSNPQCDGIRTRGQTASHIKGPPENLLVPFYTRGHSKKMPSMRKQALTNTESSAFSLLDSLCSLSWLLRVLWALDKNRKISISYSCLRPFCPDSLLPATILPVSSLLQEGAVTLAPLQILYPKPPCRSYRKLFSRPLSLVFSLPEVLCAEIGSWLPSPLHLSVSREAVPSRI